MCIYITFTMKSQAVYDWKCGGFRWLMKEGIRDIHWDLVGEDTDLERGVLLSWDEWTQEVAGLKRLADSKNVVIDKKEAVLFFSFDLLISPLQSIFSRLYKFSLLRNYLQRIRLGLGCCWHWFPRPATAPSELYSLMILPQVHLRKPCYDFYFL